MTRKARLWAGVTILIVISINYLIIGVPLIRKSMALEDKYKAILIKQVKSGEIFKSSGDSYILDLFKRESAGIDRKMLLLNCGAGSLALVVISWTVFGMVFRARK